MTTKKQKIINVPNLRFPGFEGEWEEKRLGNLLELKNGINASKEQYGEGVKFINVLDILNNDFITYDNILGRVNIDQSIIEKYPVRYGDIVFQRSSETREEVGTSNVYLDRENTAVFGGFVIRGKKIGDYNPVFFNKLLKTRAARESITSKSGGSTRYNVGQEILASISLNFPTLAEQDHISAILTLLDSRINTQSKIIEKLQTLMQSLREQLFTQKLRFKSEDKNEFPDWKKRTLGEVTYKVDKKNKDGLSLPIYSINNESGFVPQSEQFDGIDSNDRGYDISLYKIIGKRTFVYNPARINVGSIGYSGGVENVIVSSLYVCLKTTDVINDEFFNYFIKSKYFTNSVLKKGEGGVRIYLFYENFSEIPINTPSVDEQSKIADCLSAISKKIVAESSVLKQYKSQKKYLLQNMFI